MSTAEQQRNPGGRPATEPCGTPAAYKRHLRQRERERAAGRPVTEIDQACRDANAKATQKRRKARSERIDP